MGHSGFTGKRHIPYGVAALAVANAAYFLFLSAIGAVGDASAMARWGALCIESGRYAGGWYRLFTSMFMHFDIYHLGGNLLMLLAVGELLEARFGTFRVLFLYAAGGLAGNVATVLWWRFLGGSVVSAGASGAVYALVGVLCVFVLRRRRLANIPKERVFCMVFLMFYSGFANREINLAAHIGGLLSGVLYAMAVSCRSGT